MKRWLMLAALAALDACSCNAPACRDTADCPAGQGCGEAGTCLVPTLTTLTVSDASARGCEVLLTEQPGTTVTSVQFGANVVGTHLREAPRLAVTFVAAKDAALGAADVQLALAAGTAAGLTITRAACVDGAGTPLPNATLSLR